MISRRARIDSHLKIWVRSGGELTSCFSALGRHINSMCSVQDPGTAGTSGSLLSERQQELAMKQQKPTSLVLCTNKVRETRGVSEKSKLHGLSLAVKTDTKSELVEKKKI